MVSENPGGDDGADENPFRALNEFWKNLLAEERLWNKRYMHWTRWSMYGLGVLQGWLASKSGPEAVVFQAVLMVALWHGLDGVAFLGKKWKAWRGFCPRGLPR